MKKILKFLMLAITAFIIITLSAFATFYPLFAGVGDIHLEYLILGVVAVIILLVIVGKRIIGSE